MDNKKREPETYHKAWLATVAFVIDPREGIETEAQACDWVSGLLTDQCGRDVLDWVYVTPERPVVLGTSPTPIYISAKGYGETDFLKILKGGDA